ncbi:MAG: M42 family peptidase [Bacteroidetes bacterium]|nr:MAG: M42 family peptidase [Bacteroidota bacterium]
MKKKLKEFALKYLNTASPVGFEMAGQRVWLEYIKPYIDDFFVDTYGTAVGVINAESPYKVVIEAHADEISWFVNYISAEGYLHVIRNGGSDEMIAPSKRVNIHTSKGIVKAIFGWPAIHVRNEKNNPIPNQKNIVLDCGCSNKEEVAELGIHVGCVVTYEDEPMFLNEKFLVGRALDNRAGGIMIAEVARRLHKNQIKLPFGLYIVNSVQEEIGLRGAEMITERIKPNVAIVTDVCHDTHSPLYDKVVSGDIKTGKGCVLSYAPAVHNNLLNKLIETATKNNIAFQRMASSRSTGTDTDSFAYSNGGVASALISLPLKYMHTTVETVHIEDMESVINLMYQFLVQLEANTDFGYKL